MSCLWQEVASAGWQPVPLPADEPLDGSAIGLAGVEVRDTRLGAERGAVLLVRPGVRVRVNGQPIVGGVRVLDHKDEIVAGRARFYFSVESTPQLMAFVAVPGDRPPTCPVCRGPIRDGMTAVRCPGCSRWFHQMEAADGKPAKPCWTYAPTCRFCSHPTAFDATSAWRPELEDAHV